MLGALLDQREYIDRLQEELSRIDQAAMQRWSDLIYEAWEQERFVYVFGNGGSATTATHFSEDLGKSSLRESDLQDESKKRLKIMSLTDNVGWMLAVGNDVGYEDIFAQQLMNYGQPGDLVLAISGSGNSPNIVKAVDWANRHGLTTFGISGFNGGKLKQMQSDGLHVALDDMGMVESVHLCLFHWVLNDVFARINHEGRHAQ
ncbi:MAG: SIS domain-containing protein [Planctomycetaceae bacterium]|nr:SIS domain-containing protein [Planctomycetaceae bacterium]